MLPKPIFSSRFSLGSTEFTWVNVQDDPARDDPGNQSCVAISVLMGKVLLNSMKFVIMFPLSKLLVDEARCRVAARRRANFVRKECRLMVFAIFAKP